MSADLSALLQLVQALVPLETAPQPTLEDVRTLTNMVQQHGTLMFHSVVQPHVEKTYRNFLRQFSLLSQAGGAPLPDDEGQWISVLVYTLRQMRKVATEQHDGADRTVHNMLVQLSQRQAQLVKPMQRRLDDLHREKRKQHQQKRQEAEANEEEGLPALELPEPHDLVRTAPRLGSPGLISAPPPAPAAAAAASSSSSTRKRKEPTAAAAAADEDAPANWQNGGFEFAVDVDPASDEPAAEEQQRQRKKPRKKITSAAPHNAWSDNPTAATAAAASSHSHPATSISSESLETLARGVPQEKKLEAIARPLYARAYGLLGQRAQDHTALCASARAATGASLNYVYGVLYGNAFESLLSDLREMVPLHERQMDRHHAAVSPALTAALHTYNKPLLPMPTLTLDSFARTKPAAAASAAAAPPAAAAAAPPPSSAAMEQVLLDSKAETKTTLASLHALASDLFCRGFGLRDHAEESRYHLTSEAVRRTGCKPKTVNLLFHRGLFEELDELRRGLKPHEQRRQSGRADPAHFHYDGSWRIAANAAAAAATAAATAATNAEPAAATASSTQKAAAALPPAATSEGRVTRSMRAASAAAASSPSLSPAAVPAAAASSAPPAMHLDCLLDSRDTPSGGVDYLAQLCNEDGDVVDVRWLPEEKVRTRSDLIDSFERSRRLQREERQMAALDDLAAAGASHHQQKSVGGSSHSLSLSSDSDAAAEDEEEPEDGRNGFEEDEEEENEAPVAVKASSKARKRRRIADSEDEPEEEEGEAEEVTLVEEDETMLEPAAAEASPSSNKRAKHSTSSSAPSSSLHLDMPPLEFASSTSSATASAAAASPPLPASSHSSASAIGGVSSVFVGRVGGREYWAQVAAAREALQRAEEAEAALMEHQLEREAARNARNDDNKDKEKERKKEKKSERAAAAKRDEELRAQQEAAAEKDAAAQEAERRAAKAERKKQKAEAAAAAAAEEQRLKEQEDEEAAAAAAAAEAKERRRAERAAEKARKAAEEEEKAAAAAEAAAASEAAQAETEERERAEKKAKKAKKREKAEAEAAAAAAAAEAEAAEAREREQQAQTIDAALQRAAAAAEKQREREEAREKRKADKRAQAESAAAASATATRESSPVKNVKLERFPALSSASNTAPSSSAPAAAGTTDSLGDRFKRVRQRAEAEEPGTETNNSALLHRAKVEMLPGTATAAAPSSSSFRSPVHGALPTPGTSASAVAASPSAAPAALAVPSAVRDSLSELLQSIAHKPKYIVLDATNVAQWSGSGNGGGASFESWQVAAAVKAVEKSAAPLGIQVLTLLSEEHLRRNATKDVWALLALQQQKKLHTLPAGMDVEAQLVTLTQQADTFLLSNSALASQLASGLVSEAWKQAHVLKFFTFTLPFTEPCDPCRRMRTHWQIHCTLDETTGAVLCKGSPPKATVRSEADNCCLSCLGSVAIGCPTVVASSAATAVKGELAADEAHTTPRHKQRGGGGGGGGSSSSKKNKHKPLAGQKRTSGGGGGGGGGGRSRSRSWGKSSKQQKQQAS